MDVHKIIPEAVGFTEIYTSNSNEKPIVEPKKKPYIIFVLPIDDAHIQYLKEIGLASIATIESVNDQFVITVTSDRKVGEAIDIFLDTRFRYPEKDNKELYLKLLDLKSECDKQNTKKIQSQPPKKSKSLDLFKQLSPDPLNASSRVTYPVFKNNTKKTEYIFKENTTERYISELEAYNGFCFRLLLGDRHPKVRPVHGLLGEKKGFVSKLYSNFQSYHDRIKEYEKYGVRCPSPSTEELLKSEIAKVWVASYVEEENDLHGGNYGIGEGGFCVKIDDDRATWPLLAEYTGVHPERGRPEVKGYPEFEYKVAPVNAFIVRHEDIETFPKLQYASPSNWPDRSDSGWIDFTELLTRKKYQDDKHYMFLKRILVPGEVYEAIGLATVSSDKKRKQMADHKKNKTIELQNVLLKMPEFQDYIISHPKVIDEILADFNTYNRDYKKEQDSYLRVDLKQVRNNFDNIKHEISINRERLVPDILPNMNPKPTRGFFKRNPLVGDVLIGVGLGLFVVGLIAISVITLGGALPVVVGAGAAVGAAFGLSGVVATGVGLATIGAGCVALISAFTGGIGAITRKLARKTIDEGNAVDKTSQHILEEEKKPLISKQTSSSSVLTSSKEFIRPSLTTQSIFHQEINQNNIDNVIIFLKENIEFFIAPMQDQNKFSLWAAKYPSAMKLSDDLAKALNVQQHHTVDTKTKSLYSQFLEAIIGERGQNNGLRGGNDSRIKELLSKNKALYVVLNENIPNGVIDAWYNDNKVNRYDTITFNKFV